MGCTHAYLSAFVAKIFFFFQLTQVYQYSLKIENACRTLSQYLVYLQFIALYIWVCFFFTAFALFMDVWLTRYGYGLLPSLYLALPCCLVVADLYFRHLHITSPPISASISSYYRYVGSGKGGNKAATESLSIWYFDLTMWWIVGVGPALDCFYLGL